MRSEIEDGMGFAGLAPSAEERRESRVTLDLRRELSRYSDKMSQQAIEIDRLRKLLGHCWEYLFDDSGSPVAPEELRQAIIDVGCRPE